MDEDKNPAAPSAEDLALGEDKEGQDEDQSTDSQGQDEDQSNDQGDSEDQDQQDDQDEDQDQGDQGSQHAEDEDATGQDQNQSVSRRESKRIKTLLEKLKEQGQQSQPTQPTRQPQGQGPIIPEGDYDLAEVNKLAQEYAEKKYQEGLQEAVNQASAQSSSQFALGQFYTDLKLDAPTVASKYDFMNQDSENFDPGRTELINTLYLNTVGYNPGDAKSNIPASIQRNDIGYADFVESVMELVDRTNAVQAADSQANVRQQAINIGPRPGGSGRQIYQGDDPGKMTDEQLEAAINQGLSILPSARR